MTIYITKVYSAGRIINRNGKEKPIWRRRRIFIPHPSSYATKGGDRMEIILDWITCGLEVINLIVAIYQVYRTK